MGAFGKLQAYKFAVLLSKPFTEWDAFKLGIINEKGEILKRPVTSEERNSLDTFENLVRKIKKLLVKYIPDTRFLQFLIAAYLLKNESEYDIFTKITEELSIKEQDMLHGILNDISSMKNLKG